MPTFGDRDSQHSFAQIPATNQARSVFNRSYAVKDTYQFDELVPFFVEEILPGDTVHLNVNSFMRLAPQVVPVLDNMYVDFFFFFVPNRLVWDNWERFNGAQDDPGDSTDFLVPQCNLNAVPAYNRLMGHMGIPSGLTGSVVSTVNALPLRCYNLIWNWWFRDQNLQTSLTVPKGDGPDSNATFVLQKRAKPHDYFTSALPWPQKGPSISLLTGTVGVMSTGIAPNFTGTTFSNRSMYINSGTPNTVMMGGSAILSDPTITFGNQTGLQVNLAQNTIDTINTFRQAIMIQSLLELDARGGTRYIEILKAHFGVISPDFRLQMPEYLSSGTSSINQHPVAQTSESGTTPQANLAAFSTQSTSGRKIGFSKSFVEHGFVIGLLQARGEVTYQNGVNRMWFRRTRFDYFWPKLQQLGEQAILNKEVWADGTGVDDEVFGYQERYAEYRYHPSEIRGQFRSDAVASLDVWHLGQNFTTRPALNATFIQSATPIARSLAVTSEPPLLADFFFDLKHIRPMMVYGVPATLGRF